MRTFITMTNAVALLIGLIEVGTVNAAVRVKSLVSNTIVYDPLNQKL